MRLTWDEAKRAANLAKHGLDFAQAHRVLDLRWRLDVEVVRGSELRLQSFSYVLTVLTVVHVERGETVRVISFRPASSEEREVYYEWLESE